MDDTDSMCLKKRKKTRLWNLPRGQSSQNHPSSMLLCLQRYREDQSLLRSINNIWNISFVLAGKEILTCLSSFGSLCSSFCQDVLRCPKWGIGPTPYICRTGVIMCGLNPLLLLLKPCLFFHSFPAELNASWHCLYIRICHSNFSTWSTATRGQHV